jgi:hypothetical protein
LNLKCVFPVSKFAFKFNLYRYTEAVATLGGAYLTVTKLGEGPVTKKGFGSSARMPETDRPTPAKAVAAPVEAPAVALE